MLDAQRPKSMAINGVLPGQIFLRTERVATASLFVRQQPAAGSGGDKQHDPITDSDAQTSCQPKTKENRARIVVAKRAAFDDVQRLAQLAFGVGIHRFADER